MPGTERTVEGWAVGRYAGWAWWWPVPAGGKTGAPGQQREENMWGTSLQVFRRATTIVRKEHRNLSIVSPIQPLRPAAPARNHGHQDSLGALRPPQPALLQHCRRPRPVRQHHPSSFRPSNRRSIHLSDKEALRHGYSRRAFLLGGNC